MSFKKLAPSILNSNFANLLQQIRYLEIGGADYIHCDVMDGVFVPNLTFGAPIIKSIDSITKLPLDVHLMIVNPERHIDTFIDAGADILTFHYEAAFHHDRIISKIKESNIKAGISINPSTPIIVLENILPLVDLVLIMSVNPGFGGQSFLEYTIEKIERLNRIRIDRNLKFLIEIDGGVSLENVNKIIDAGADIIVVGSAIFKANNITESVAKFKANLF